VPARIHRRRHERARRFTIEQEGLARAAYGEALVERLGRDLTAPFGRGFSATNLKPMRAFHLAWPGGRIGQTPSDEFDRDGASALARAADALALIPATFRPDAHSS